MANHEYEVCVFCDQPKGYASHEKRDGVEVRRFKCFSAKDFTRDALDLVDRYPRSAEASRGLLSPVVELVEALLELGHVSERSAEILENPKLYKETYNHANGAKRLQLKSRHIAAKMALKARAIADSGLEEDVHIWREKLRIERELEKTVRETFHASAFIFARNLLQFCPAAPPQIVHAHDLFTVPAALELKRLHGCKVIYDAHEIETARATKMPKTGRAHVDALERDCLDQVDAVVTVSESIGKFYEARFEGPAPTVVMNAPEVTLSPAQAVKEGIDIRSKVGLSREVPLLVYTGGIQREHRGLHKVVEALAAFKDVHLATLGARHPNNDDWLLSHAERHATIDRLHLVDAVPADHVVGTIASATASIIPIQGVSLSYQMAMPNKLFEAAIARLPILVSDLPDMRNFVEDLDIGIVMDHTSVEGIADAIRSLLESQRTSWGTPKTNDLLENHFSWSAQQRSLLALYDALTAET